MTRFIEVETIDVYGNIKDVKYINIEQINSVQQFKTLGDKIDFPATTVVLSNECVWIKGAPKEFLELISK